MPVSGPNTDRRDFLATLLALPALALFRSARNERGDTLVEVDGWILKRSDLI